MPGVTALLPKPSYEQVSTLLDEIVTEYGADYIYRRPDGAANGRDDAAASCLYMHGTDTPGCIIGVLLFKLGIDKKWLYNHDSMGIGARYFDIFGRDEPDQDQRKALSLMVSVQSFQDNGYTWGEAVSLSKERMSRE